MTLVIEDNDLASVSIYPFRDMFQTDDKNIYYKLIHRRGVLSKFMICQVDLVYNGECTVNQRDCEDFLKI